ncbi:MAG TPA: PD-(D/E)XK nuclease family protein [Candidatus Desulfobacillus sp.]|nr:PD-(D/E)XK nuclease family protein [Candidatus Desulfobacillus sp.]
MPEAAHNAALHPVPLGPDGLARCARRIVAELSGHLPDLSDALIVLPSPLLAPALRQALAATAGRVILLPRIATLEQLASAGQERGVPDSRRQLLLYRLLREQGWFAGSALWEIGAELLALFDELNERASSLPRDEAEFVDRLERAYAARGSQPLRFEAELVHRLWRAEATGPPSRPVAMALTLAELAARAAGPLFVLCDGAPRPVERAFCQAWSARQNALLFQPERAAAEDPLLQALNLVWPPGVADDAPLDARAAAAARAWPESPLSGRLRLLGAESLEAEAAAVAAEVKRWLAGGRRDIALVAADRAAARRARALLERDGVLVRDETGWKLSTTRAAALVDAWLEVHVADGYHRDLLDLAKSPFVFDDLPEPDRQAGLLQLEGGLARHNLIHGIERCRTTLARVPGHEKALLLLGRMAGARRKMPRGEASLAGWLDGLEQALAELGALASLTADAAGATLLELLRARREELAAVPARLGFGEWREWLNRELEDAAFVDRGIDSPVVMTHLAATRLRRFDAAVVIGVDRDNLAPQRSRAVFDHPAVREDLGLSLPAEARARLRDDLAGLVASCGEVTATWQLRRDDEQNLLSPELDLLRAFHARAWGKDLQEAPPAPAIGVAAPGRGTAMPRPRAPQLVPLRVSASAHASLLACPYQFFARRMLGLSEAQEVREALEKRDYGEFVHRILQRFHAVHPRITGLAEDVLATELESISREVFAPEIARNFLGHAWLARWLQRAAGYLAWQKGREAAGWRYAGSELEREVRLVLDDGAEVALHGRIDRLDRRDGGSEAVLDFKTQDAQKLKKRLRDSGEDAQLASYVLLQGGNVAEAAYVGLDGDKPVEVPLPGAQAVAQAQGARLAAVIGALRRGAALPAHGIDAVCAVCEMRGLCRKDYHAADTSLAPGGGASA